MDAPHYEAGPLEPIIEARESSALKYSPSPDKYQYAHHHEEMEALRPSTAHNEEGKEDYPDDRNTPKPGGDNVRVNRERSSNM